jgi:ABC-2 type transport system permease protein
MSFKRIVAIARKEFRHILRDARSLTMALAVPLVLLLLFGFALSLDVDRIPTAIYDQDRSAESRELIERFRGSRFFDVREMADSYSSIERDVDRNQVLLAIVIPHDYSRHLTTRQLAEVQIILDGSDSNTASIAMGYAETVVRNQQLGLGAAASSSSAPFAAGPLDARPRVWYNSELLSRNYVVPGLVAVILMVIASLLTSLTIAREWEAGTMEQLLSTPVRPAELVLGKMTAFFAVGIIDMLVAIGAAVAVFHVPFRGSLLFLVCTGSLFLWGSLFWGIFLSALARSQLLAYQLGMLTSFLPALMLSGFVYSIRNMPLVIRLVTRVVAARYFVTILTGVFLKGIGIEVLWSETALLLAFAVIVFVFATLMLGRKVA